MARRGAALGAGTVAVLAGIVFLLLVGAPTGMAVRNGAAYATGIALGALGLAAQPRRLSPFLPRYLLTLVMLVVVLVAGVTVDGVQRWIRLGPLTLQPALILLPALLATIGDDKVGMKRAALLLPAALLALQPDAGTLGALALALTVMTLQQRSPLGVVAAAGTAALAGWTIVTLDNPAPVLFVEATAELALANGPLALALHLGASLLMLVPFAIAPTRRGRPLLAFVAALTVAGLLDAFPMPLAGGAISPLIGYGAALALLFPPIGKGAPIRR